MEKVTIGFRMTEEEAQALAKLAKDDGRSLSTFVARICQAYLSNLSNESK